MRSRAVASRVLPGATDLERCAFIRIPCGGDSIVYIKFTLDHFAPPFDDRRTCLHGIRGGMVSDRSIRSALGRLAAQYGFSTRPRPISPIVLTPHNAIVVSSSFWMICSAVVT